jgi:hypothetical protein
MNIREISVAKNVLRRRWRRARLQIIAKRNTAKQQTARCARYVTAVIKSDAKPVEIDGLPHFLQIGEASRRKQCHNRHTIFQSKFLFVRIGRNKKVQAILRQHTVNAA